MLNPLSLRFCLQELAILPSANVNRGDIGVIVKHIEEELIKNDLVEDMSPSVLRRMIFGFLFGDADNPIEEMSSHELTDGQILALKKWIGAQKIEETWIPKADFLPELIEVVKVVKYLHNK